MSTNAMKNNLTLYDVCIPIFCLLSKLRQYHHRIINGSKQLHNHVKPARLEYLNKREGKNGGT